MLPTFKELLLKIMENETEQKDHSAHRRHHQEF
jgi:hypothetical protein